MHQVPKYSCIAEWVEKIGAYRESPAILAPGQPTLTYGKLENHIKNTVKSLRGFGVSREDRLAVVSPNGPEAASAFLNVIAGAACAPLNPSYKKEEYEFYLDDLKPKAVIVHSNLDNPVRGTAREKNIPVIELVPLPQHGAGYFRLEGEPAAPVSTDPFPGPRDTALILHTSGTTSRPKMVPLSQLNIFTSAHNIGTTLRLTAKDRCLNVMPLFHIHGLMAAVLASFNVFGSIVCTPGFSDESFFSRVTEFRPTWYTAVPTIHQSVLQLAEANPGAAKSASFRFIRSSSSSLPPQVMKRMEDLFDVPLIEAYGMSEAAHQMACNPLPPGERKPGSVGIPAGPGITILDETGSPLPAGKTGEVAIRGENVMHGYENNPGANDNAFSNGWFRTGDQGYFDDGGYLFLTGRLKELINRGGQKISPREIDEVLMDHPAVRQAVAFAIPHQRLGEAVGAVVVPAEGHRISEKDLRHFAAERLAPYKVPQQIVFTGHIPKGATGKLQRIGLAEKLSHLLEPGYHAPRNRLEEQLAGIWSEVLGVEADRVGIHANFFALGGDSLLAARMRSRVLERLHIDLPVGPLFQYPTLEGLAGVLAQYGPAPAAGADTAAALPGLLSRVENLSEEDAARLLADG